MATWHWADLSTTASLRPVPLALGDPVAYGVSECDDSGPGLHTGGCPIRVGRVVYPVSNGAGDELIFELSLDNGRWFNNDLSTATPKYSAPAGDYRDDPTAYVSFRNGIDHGMATVTYVAERDIMQLTLTGSGWTYQNVLDSHTPNPTAKPAAAGSAFGYWDSDNNVDRIVYRGYPPDDQIYEITTFHGQWACNDLLTNDKSQPPAPPTAGNPMGYSFGGVPRVVYRGANGHIYELHPEPYWRCNDLTEIAGGAPPASSDPFGYATNLARVVYTDTSGQIIELSLEKKWEWNNLSTNVKGAPAAPASAGKPFGYSTWDDTLRVIYRGTDGHVHELHSSPATKYFWAAGDLSAIAGATASTQLAAGDPVGYEIFDSIARVVYRAGDGHINELSLH